MIIKEQFKGYIYFIRTQGVAGFAIGFILGKAVSDLVGSFVNDIINPLIGLVFRSFGDLSQAVIVISDTTINYGKFLSLFINFFILAAIVYFGIKKLAVKLDQPKE
ncbi:MAG TPA: MscL family protein [Candidatus Paceibacterota bacterium]